MVRVCYGANDHRKIGMCSVVDQGLDVVDENLLEESDETELIVMED